MAGWRIAGDAVDLLHARVDGHPPRGRLAEIDLRPLDGHDAGLLGRNAAHGEDRQPLRRRLADRAHHGAVAMGVGEVLVLPRPGIGLQPGQIELASGDQHLLDLVQLGIAIDVDVIELIVGNERPQALVGIAGNPVVPEPDVAQDRRVGLQRCRRRLALTAQAPRLDAIEAKANAREGDVVGNERTFPLQLVRLDNRLLHDARNDLADADRGKPGDEDDGEPSHLVCALAEQQDERSGDRNERQDEVQRTDDVDVGEAWPRDKAAV